MKTALFFSLIFFQVMANAGVFFDDESGGTPEAVQKPRSHKESSAIHVKTGANGLELRKVRRAAVGVQAAGAMGIGGAVLELNFTPNWAFDGGFGGGEGFQSYMLQGKYVLAGDWLMPYMAFGYANWTSLGKSTYIEKTRPTILAERLLTDDEKAAGKYKKHFIYPSFGLQFMQLDGEWAGFSMYGEITVLLDFLNFTAGPTASLGFMYYF